MSVEDMSVMDLSTGMIFEELVGVIIIAGSSLHGNEVSDVTLSSVVVAGGIPFSDLTGSSIGVLAVVVS